MSIYRLFYILGIILIFWAIISGLYIHIESSNGEFTFDSNYTFKLGTLIFGFLLVFIGRKKG